MAGDSEPCARHEDEQAHNRRSNDNDGGAEHESALHQETANKRFLDPGEREERVLAIPGQSEHRVHGVLVRGKRVDAYEERKDDLQYMLACPLRG